MKVSRVLSAALITVFVLCGAAIAQDVHTDYDHHVDFSQFHTFSWSKVQTDNPFWVQRIKDAVDKDLEAKGWQKVQSGGQVTLSAVAAVRNQQEYQTFYDGMGGWWWGGFGDTATTTVQNQRVGTLVVDMYNSSNKKLIWRGIAANTLSNSAKNNEKKLHKATEKMFKHFPPKESKES